MQTGGLVFVFCPRRGSGWRPTFSTLPCSSQQEVSASPAAGPPWGRRTCPRCQRAWLPALPRSSPAVSLWLFSVGRLIAAHQALGPVAAQVLMPPGEGGQGAAPLTGGCRNHGSAQECHMLGPEPGSWRPLCDLEQRSRPRGARGRCGRPSPHPRLTWAGGGDDVLLARAPPPSLPGPACAAQVLGVVGVASALGDSPGEKLSPAPNTRAAGASRAGLVALSLLLTCLPLSARALAGCGRPGSWPSSACDWQCGRADLPLRASGPLCTAGHWSGPSAGSSGSDRPAPGLSRQPRMPGPLPPMPALP